MPNVQPDLPNVSIGLLLLIVFCKREPYLVKVSYPPELLPLEACSTLTLWWFCATAPPTVGGAFYSFPLHRSPAGASTAEAPPRLPQPREGPGPGGREKNYRRSSLEPKWPQRRSSVGPSLGSAQTQSLPLDPRDDPNRRCHSNACS